MSSTFPTLEAIAVLTGRKQKSKQIEALRRMRLPFWVNACGQPVVTRVTVEGKPSTAGEPKKATWEPERKWRPKD